MDIPNTEYDNIIFYFILLIIYITIQNHFYTIWKKKEKKKRRNMWIQVLRKNEMIDECLIEFEKIRYVSNIYSFISMLIGITLGIIFMYKSFIYFQDITSNMWTAGALISLINFIPYLFLIITIGIIKERWTDLEKANVIKYYFTGINWFVFSTNLFIILFFIIIISRWNEFNGPDMNLFIMLYFVSFTLLASIIFGLRRFEQTFYEKIENSLSKLYLNKFPNLEITINEEKLTGNLEDIFNEKIIVLNKNGLKVVIEWDSISSLKFYEKVIQNDLSFY